MARKWKTLSLMRPPICFVVLGLLLVALLLTCLFNGAFDEDISASKHMNTLRAYDSDEITWVNVTLTNLSDIYYAGPTFEVIFRLQYNRILTEDENTQILDQIKDAGYPYNNATLYFSYNEHVFGYDGAGVDINCTYITIPLALGENPPIPLTIPSDIIFLEHQGLSDKGQATYSGENYFTFMDFEDPPTVLDYPLKRGNMSLKGLGLNDRTQPTISGDGVVLDAGPIAWNPVSIYKLDKATSSSFGLSGNLDPDGCSISYILGVTATNYFSTGVLTQSGIPTGNLILDDYKIIRVSIDKEIFDNVFNPYTNTEVAEGSYANYMSLSFNIVAAKIGRYNPPLPTTSYYGASAIDIAQTGSNDDNYYYVYFTTDPDLYSTAVDSKTDELPTSLPVINLSGDPPEKKGILLYNNNINDFQAGLLIRFRDGNYDVPPLATFKNKNCYNTPFDNKEITLSWLTVEYLIMK